MQDVRDSLFISKTRSNMYELLPYTGYKFGCVINKYDSLPVSHYKIQLIMSNQAIIPPSACVCVNCELLLRICQ